MKPCKPITTNDRQCAECQTSMTDAAPGKKHRKHASFCSAACKSKWHNRRRTRAGGLYDFAMAWMLDNRNRDKLNNLCRQVAIYMNRDKEAGIKSYGDRLAAPRPKADKIARDRRKRTPLKPCVECGEPIERIATPRPGVKARKFCAPACKASYNKRRQARGLMIYDMLFRWRADRTPQSSAARSALYKQLKAYRDRDRKDGRTTHIENPYLNV